MPGMPEEELEGCGNSLNDFKGETVREITQTDHLNKKLLTSYLNSIKTSNSLQSFSEDNEKNEEEEQNWDND